MVCVARLERCFAVTSVNRRITSKRPTHGIGIASSVCLCMFVFVLVVRANPDKMSGKLPWALERSSSHVLVGDAHWRNTANTIKQSVVGGDMARRHRYCVHGHGDIVVLITKRLKRRPVKSRFHKIAAVRKTDIQALARRHNGNNASFKRHPAVSEKNMEPRIMFGIRASFTALTLIVE